MLERWREWEGKGGQDGTKGVSTHLIGLVDVLTEGMALVRAH